MKIHLFGLTFKFLEPSEEEKNRSINFDTIRMFLNKLSIQEQEKLFYNLFELYKNSSKLHIEYQLSKIKFNHPNLHPMMNHFFSTFEYFEYFYETSWGHKYIQDYNDYLKSLEIEPDEDITSIVIGNFHGYAIYTRYNSIFSIDEDCDDGNKDEETRENSITFFEHLLFDMIYDLDGEIPAQELIEDIHLKYFLLCKS